MSAEAIGKITSAVVSLAWAGIAFFVIWQLRSSFVGVVQRFSGFEGWGVKFSLTGGQQGLDAAFEVAAKHPNWPAEATEEERRQAIDRAKANRTLIEGAEILWVDDRPSNNRNESRMLRSFGALITFACTTEEAVEVLSAARVSVRPFHIVLSDIARTLPAENKRAGLDMLPVFQAAGITLPVIFYVGEPAPGAGTPPGAFAITHRPDELLNYIVDALGRVRGS